MWTLALTAALAADAPDPSPQRSRADPDPWTALAVGTASYATLALTHEVLGHGGACALAGGRPLGFATTNMVCDTAGMGAGDIRFGTFAGTGANLIVGTSSAVALGLGRPEDPWTRHYLWTTTSSQLFLGGSYLLTGALFDNGDFGIYLDTVRPARRGGTRAALAVAGATVIGLTFPLSMVLGEPMLGDTRSLRTRRKWVLGMVPYAGVGVGLMALTGALHRELGPGRGATAALVGYGLGTLYVGYMPLVMASKPPATPREPGQPFRRDPRWLAAGAASLGVLVALGVGIGRLDPEPLDNWQR